MVADSVRPRSLSSSNHGWALARNMNKFFTAFSSAPSSSAWKGIKAAPKMGQRFSPMGNNHVTEQCVSLKEQGKLELLYSSLTVCPFICVNIALLPDGNNVLSANWTHEGRN